MGFAGQAEKGPAKGLGFFLGVLMECRPLVLVPGTQDATSDVHSDRRCTKCVRMWYSLLLPHAGSASHRSHAGGLFVSVTARWARVKPGSCLTENPVTFMAVERPFYN